MALSKPQKFIVVISSFFIAFPSYFLAFAHLSRNLTEWQKEQEIDLFAKTGSTKFQVYIDSLSVAGLVFVFSAIMMLLAIRFSKK